MHRNARLAAVLAGLLVAGSTLADTITIRSDPWLPYNGVGNQAPAGYMIELARLIAEAEGHEIDYRNLPWDDALAAVREGRFDCVVGATRGDAPDFAFPANAWGQSQSVFFAMADSGWRWNGVESLEGKRLAVIEGYAYGEGIDAYIEQHKADPARVVVVNSVGRAAVAAVSNLVGRRADIWVENRFVGVDTLTKLELAERIVERGALDAPEDVFIGCTPADPRGARYAEMFSDGIARLRSEGKLAEVLARYGLRDWTAP
jgi:polar amino acid transport system substrate-binding protein